MPPSNIYNLPVVGNGSPVECFETQKEYDRPSIIQQVRTNRHWQSRTFQSHTRRLDPRPAFHSHSEPNKFLFLLGFLQPVPNGLVRLVRDVERSLVRLGGERSLRIGERLVQVGSNLLTVIEAVE